MDRWINREIDREIEFVILRKRVPNHDSGGVLSLSLPLSPFAHIYLFNTSIEIIRAHIQL